MAGIYNRDKILKEQYDEGFICGVRLMEQRMDIASSYGSIMETSGRKYVVVDITDRIANTPVGRNGGLRR